MTSEQHEVTRVLAEKIDSLPSLPEVSDRILSLLQDEEVSVESVEQIIRTDPSLVGRVLQLANKRYYGHKREVTSLNRAIQILGFNTLRSVAVSQSMENEYSAPEVSNFPRDEFWTYSLAVGVAGEIIGDRLGCDGEKKAEFFSAGHLHAIGKSIVDQYLHREFVKIMELVRDQSIPMCDAEQEVLNLTHCEVGEAVLDNWNLPEPIVAAVRYYYRPEDAPDDVDQRIVDVVHLGSVLAKTKGYGFSGDTHIRYLNEDRVEALGFDDSEVQQLLDDDYPDKFETFQS
jgi:HD-like signal output (HDOD) protein